MKTGFYILEKDTNYLAISGFKAREAFKGDIIEILITTNNFSLASNLTRNEDLIITNYDHLRIVNEDELSTIKILYGKT